MESPITWLIVPKPLFIMCLRNGKAPNINKVWAHFLVFLVQVTWGTKIHTIEN